MNKIDYKKKYLKYKNKYIYLKQYGGEIDIEMKNIKFKTKECKLHDKDKLDDLDNKIILQGKKNDPYLQDFEIVEDIKIKNAPIYFCFKEKIIEFYDFGEVKFKGTIDLKTNKYIYGSYIEYDDEKKKNYEYIGSFKDNKKEHGKLLEFKEGYTKPNKIYLGNFNNNKKNGFGRETEFLDKPNTLKKTFAGNWKDNYKHGPGIKIEYDTSGNETKTIGIWFNGNLKSSKSIINDKITKETGNHEKIDQELEKQTVIHYDDNKVNQIIYEDKKKTLVNYDYNGEWVDGKKQGKGILITFNNDVKYGFIDKYYEGNFVNDKYEGEGYLKLYKTPVQQEDDDQSSLIPEGLFDEPEILIASYYGSFKDGLYHGKGIYNVYNEYALEAVYEGKFNEGKPIGKFKKTENDNTSKGILHINDKHGITFVKY